MTLFFSNLPGLFALLGIPVLVAIHFLQNRSKVRRMSTLFLLEALAPESRSGRIWDKLILSRNLWLQLLCVLLLAWVLAQPRWLRDNSSQSMVFIMDDSVQMQPFKKEAIQAVSKDMSAVDGWGIPTRWIIASSSGRKKAIYNGASREEAIQALASWTPDSGEHDPTPALKTASAIAGAAGITRFITWSSERTPKWQAATGVGKALNNVGIVGITPVEDQSMPRWRVAIKNSSPTHQARTISVQAGTGKPVTQTLSLPPGTVSEFHVALPSGVDSSLVALSPDDFARDDQLPLVRPRPKPISVQFDLPTSSRMFFEKITTSLPGARASAKEEKPGIVIRQTDNAPTAEQASIILAKSSAGHISSAPVLSEPHPLTKDLAWGSLLIPSPGKLVPGNRASTLLWKGNTPLAWIEENSLVLNWEWDKSNASRLPSTALIIRRFIDKTRNTSEEETSLNIPTSSLIDIPKASKVEFSPLSGSTINLPYTGIDPGSPGFFSIFNTEGKRLVQGATFTADARAGDFSACSTFEQPLPNRRKLAEKISSPDPFVPLWLALAGIAMLWSWLPPSQERRTLS